MGETHDFGSRAWAERVKGAKAFRIVTNPSDDRPPMPVDPYGTDPAAWVDELTPAFDDWRKAERWSERQSIYEGQEAATNARERAGQYQGRTLLKLANLMSQVIDMAKEDPDHARAYVQTIIVGLRFDA